MKNIFSIVCASFAFLFFISSTAALADYEDGVEAAFSGDYETAFKEFGIEARIVSVQGPQLVGRQHLELPIQVREERDVRLNEI